jgi:hypothetical protein
MAITQKTRISNMGVYLLSVLMLTIVIVPLAAAVLTVTTDQSEYVPGDILVVTGTATPDSAVAIQVYNPAGGRIAFGQASTDTAGAYSVSVLTWPATATVSQPYGTYRVSVSDAGNGDTTEVTTEFAESATPVTTTTTSSVTTVTETITARITTTSTITTTETTATTNTVTATTTRTLPVVTTTSTATTTATTTVASTVTAQAVTSTVTNQVTQTTTEEVDSIGTVTYAAIAVAIIAIVGAALIYTKKITI